MHEAINTGLFVAEFSTGCYRMIYLRLNSLQDDLPRAELSEV